jgi:hypothetical protein
MSHDLRSFLGADRARAVLVSSAADCAACHLIESGVSAIERAREPRELRTDIGAAHRAQRERACSYTEQDFVRAVHRLRLFSLFAASG